MLLTSCFHVALGAHRVCVAAAREEDPGLGTVPVVERRLLGRTARSNCAGLEREWNHGIFRLCPGNMVWGLPPTLRLEMLRRLYYYCQCEETMGGMRWLSRSVRSLMAACLEGDRQAGQGILCLGLLYVCLTSSSAMR